MTNDKTTLEFAGDNPCVVLYDAEGTVTSAISYWNASFSLAGAGRALFFVASLGGHLEGRLFSENQAATDFFRSFNQHFLGFGTVAWADINPEPAQFNAGWSGNGYGLRCLHDHGSIDVEWRDLASPYILRSTNRDFGGEVDRSYDVSSVIMAATEGTIRVDGKALPGSVKGPYGALPRSAFLAFCETWDRL